MSAGAFAMHSARTITTSASLAQFELEPPSLKAQDLAGVTLILYMVQFSIIRARACASILRMTEERCQFSRSRVIEADVPFPVILCAGPLLNKFPHDFAFFLAKNQEKQKKTRAGNLIDGIFPGTLGIPLSGAPPPGNQEKRKKALL